MSTTKTESHIFLKEVEQNPQPGPYANAIAAANQAGTEYWGIWNILAFRSKAAEHLVDLSQEIMSEDAPITPAFRELIAAYTSSLNNCDFCMKAHMAVSSQQYKDEALIKSVIQDPETSPLSEKEKALLRFVRRLTLDSGSINESHIALLHDAGWDDTSVYYAIQVCALFNFYNRFVSGNGVKLVSDEAFRRLAARMADNGYRRRE